MARENEQDHDSVWRHLDLAVWRLEVRARLRRLRCPEHRVLVEGVPFARYGARFTRDFENVVAWLADQDRPDRDHEAGADRLGDRRADHRSRRRRTAPRRPSSPPNRRRATRTPVPARLWVIVETESPEAGIDLRPDQVLAISRLGARLRVNVEMFEPDTPEAR
jgi:hypothetical protein